MLRCSIYLPYIYIYICTGQPSSVLLETYQFHRPRISTDQPGLLFSRQHVAFVRRYAGTEPTKKSSIFPVKFLHWEIPLPIPRLISPWAAIPSAFVCLQKPIAHVRGLSQTFIKTLLVRNGDEQPSKERKRKAEGRKKGSKFHVRDRLRSHSEKRSCSARLKKEGKLAKNA